jgi:phosphoribosylanthranilate isomerase
MSWIKFCGITNIEDALIACHLQVNAIGFIFAQSPRRVTCELAKVIIEKLPQNILKVGVFVNEDENEVKKVANYCRLDMLQFHGSESPDYCLRFSLPVIKAFRIKDFGDLCEIKNYKNVLILLDTYNPSKVGGKGETFSQDIAIKAKGLFNFILSGGLNPLNVGKAIRIIRPFGVDVCSGIEKAPGKKDITKMIDFISEVKKAYEETG